MFSNLQALPPLRIPDKQKTKKWAEKCLDAADTVGLFSNSQLRAFYLNKVTNYNLFTNIINRADVERVINPHGLELDAFPDDFRHIGLGNSMIRSLAGQHSKRRFDWKVIISSKDEKGISSKEDQKMDMIREAVQKMIMKEGMTEEEIQKELARTQDYLTYSWQDLREQTANKIVKYYYQQQELAYQFNENFIDLLISGEAITVVEEIRGDLVVRKGNPLNFYTVNGPQARTFDDCDIITEYGYKQPGEIIDDFGDELTPSEIDSILTGTQLNKGVQGPITTQNIDTSIEGRYGIIRPDYQEVSAFGGMYRMDGSIRVMKCWWRSYRKIGLLHFLDEDGNEQTKFVDERYKPDQATGEWIEKYTWVTDWWQGYKIGGDIYVGCKPCPSQCHSFTNPSKSSPPVIGTITCINTTKAQSFMDICKPFDYHYNIYYYQRELLTTSNLGSVLVMPISMKPAHMSMTEWMAYVQLMKIMVVDPTAEVLKGPAQGQAAGNFNATQAQVLNFNQGQLIQQITGMMEAVKQDMHMVTGVLPGALTQTAPSTSATGINAELQATSNATEIWFNYMDFHKRRVLEKILDVGKNILKKNPLKAQVILDDYGIAMLETSDDFLETEYDLHISNSGKENEIFQKLEQLFHAAMQNGTAKLSTIAQMYLNDSTQAALRKLQAAEDQAMQQQQQQAEMVEQTKQQGIQADAEIRREELELKRAELEKDYYKIDQDNRTKVFIEQMKSLAIDDEGGATTEIIDSGEMALKQQEVIMKSNSETMKHARELAKLNSDRELKLKEIAAKQEAEQLKAKVARENMRNDISVAKINLKGRNKAKPK